MVRLSLVLAVAGLLVAGRARADEPGVQRVAVVALSFGGPVTEAGRDMFRRRLAQGLTAARFEVLAGARLKDRLRNADACADQSCFPALARALGVGYLVVGEVREQSKTYDIGLELVNGHTGAALGSVHEQCETCGIEEAGEKMDLAASALRARLEAVTRVPARFVIRSRPADAEARIDGRTVGRTPVDIELAGGEHHLTLDLGGHDALHRTFIAVSGVDETLDLDLVAQPTTFPYRAVGWTALALGAVGIAGGALALAVDGREVSCPASGPGGRDAMGHCPRIWRTNLLGAVLLGMGSAMGTAGGVSLYFASRGGMGGEPSAQRPFSIAWSGRF